MTIAKDGTVHVKVGSEVRIGEYGYGGGPRLDYRGGESIYVETDLDSVIKQLQDIRKQYKNEYSLMSILGVRDCGCYRDCTCSETLYVYGRRQANDIEKGYYAEQKAKQEAEQLARDRADLERLQRKLGVDVLT